MLSTKLGIHLINASALLNFLATNLKVKRHRTYDYTHKVPGQDYVFEVVADDYTKGCMTAQGKGISVGDFITLQENSEVYRYQVEQIDYYSNPNDMWTAILKRITGASQTPLDY
ncbi:MAG: hypothetical protein IGS39_23280 [Calothrix sp. C42_A2020_038]|nr:hypothetical protein [Calothrix sp. C42_A2020_038]